MKNIRSFLILVILTSASSFGIAQSPNKMSYQAVIRNGSGELISNHEVRTKVSILKDSPNGTKVYSEIHLSTTNANGLTSFVIGNGTSVSGDIAIINWEQGPYFIKTETDPVGGTSFSISGTSELLSVPFALFAANGGTQGPRGLQGDKGDKGDKGFNGVNGTNGIDGEKGSKGDPGPQGLIGPKGDKGDIGERGDLGDDGPKGDKGDKGDQGNVGPMGSKGNKGDKGDKGDQGLQGFQGVQGFQGLQGIEGLQGPPGPTGGANQQIIFNDNNVTSGDPEFLFDKSTNSIVLGSTTINPNVAFEIQSVSGSFMLPRMSTVQRNLLSASPGMMIYNTEEDKFQGYSNEFSSASGAQSEVSSAAYSIHWNVNEMTAIAQSFKPAHNGELQQIEIKINNFDPGIVLSVTLYSGSTPGEGVFLTSEQFTVVNTGWNIVNFPSGIELHSHLNYYFILSTSEVTSDQASVWTSQGSSGGEHIEGSIFYFNSDTEDFEADLLNDVDFNVIQRINSPGWKNLY
ncbi:MAG: hypothetical protein ABJB16_05830 [Saprospiraceae bacterium]